MRCWVLPAAVALMLPGCAAFDWARDPFGRGGAMPPDPPPASADTTPVVTEALTAPVPLPAADTGYRRALQPVDVGEPVMTDGQRELQRLRQEMDVMQETVIGLGNKLQELSLQAQYFGGVSYEASGEFSAALEVYKGILEATGESPYAADACFRIGAICQNRYNNYDEAVRYFKRLIADYPASPRVRSAYYELGQTYNRTGDYESANVYYRRLVQGFPSADKAPDAQFEVAQNLARLNNLVGAIDACRQLLARYPSSQVADDAQYKIGEYLRSLGRNSEALNAYQQVIDRWPRSGLASFAQFEIGQTHAQLGNNAAARTAFETYLRRYPDAVYVERARTRLESLR
ncbi:MAG TPA: tetratricopeptide repeat protein [bacterium]|nr:tetratricopeptide repeat protein [bacterium]